MKITSINGWLRDWPRAIESEQENERVWSVIDVLTAKGESNLTPEELQLLEILTDLAEDYENRSHPVQIEDAALRKPARKASEG